MTVSHFLVAHRSFSKLLGVYIRGSGAAKEDWKTCSHRDGERGLTAGLRVPCSHGDIGYSSVCVDLHRILILTFRYSLALFVSTNTDVYKRITRAARINGVS